MPSAVCEVPTVEWLKIIVQAVGYIGGWIAVVLGWWVAWRTVRKHEQRKETRALVDRLIAVAHDVERDAVKLLTAAPSPNESIEISSVISRLDRLSRALSRMRRTSGYDCRNQMIEYRQAITRGDLESANRKALTPSDTAIKNIGWACLSLVDQMENEFTRIYR